MSKENQNSATEQEIEDMFQWLSDTQLDPLVERDIKAGKFNPEMLPRYTSISLAQMQEQLQAATVEQRRKVLDAFYQVRQRSESFRSAIRPTA